MERRLLLRVRVQGGQRAGRAGFDASRRAWHVPITDHRARTGGHLVTWRAGCSSTSGRPCPGREVAYVEPRSPANWPSSTGCGAT
jgi:hypothetical protein